MKIFSHAEFWLLQVRPCCILFIACLAFLPRKIPPAGGVSLMTRPLSTLLFVLILSSAASAQTKLLPATTSIEQAVDHYIDARLKEENITPAPSVDDTAILRRLTLDLNGRVPTLGEMNEYLS